MAVSDDFRVAMWRDVLMLSKVNRGESVIILTGENSNLQNLDAATRASLALGAQAFRVDLPPIQPQSFMGSDRTLNVGTTPLTGQAVALDVLKRAGMIIDLMGLLHSPEQLAIL